MRVAKWGDSLVVSIPPELVEEMGVKEGDEVSLAFKARPSAESRIENGSSTEDLFARVRKIRRPLPADFKFDREEANER